MLSVHPQVHSCRNYTGVCMLHVSFLSVNPKKTPLQRACQVVSGGVVEAARSRPMWCLSLLFSTSEPLCIFLLTHFLCLCMSQRTRLFCPNVSLKAAKGTELESETASCQTQTKTHLSKDSSDTRLFNSTSSS